MRLLVTGVTGRIGERVLVGLAEAGHEVTVLSRSPVSAAVTSVAQSVTRGSIMEAQAWRSALAGVDGVVHMAGVSDERPEAVPVNLGSTTLMVDACLDTDVKRIVLASSNCVLGHCDRPSGTPFPFQYLPIDEDHPTDYVNHYGRSKQLAEDVLRTATSSGSLSAIALRPAWVWRDEERRQRRSNEWDGAFLEPALWAYIDIDDFVDAVEAALVSEMKSSFDAMYVSAADTAADLPSAELVARYYPHLASSAASLQDYESFFSWRRAEAVIGYRPTRSWRD